MSGDSNILSNDLCWRQLASLGVDAGRGNVSLGIEFNTTDDYVTVPCPGSYENRVKTDVAVVHMIDSGSRPRNYMSLMIKKIIAVPTSTRGTRPTAASWSVNSDRGAPWQDVFFETG